METVFISAACILLNFIYLEEETSETSVNSLEWRDSTYSRFAERNRCHDGFMLLSTSTLSDFDNVAVLWVCSGPLDPTGKKKQKHFCYEDGSVLSCWKRKKFNTKLLQPCLSFVSRLVPEKFSNSPKQKDEKLLYSVFCELDELAL